MKKMQAVQPKVKQIQEKYKRYKKTDPRRAEMNQEVMALYKAHNVNPLGGCLPLILQMPLLFAFYRLLASWVLHTYLTEHVKYSPIVCLYAVPERGKSRTGKGMIYVAYRGIHVESMRDAYIVRVAHDLHASIFFDVKDIWRKAEKNGSEDVLLHRFEIADLLFREQVLQSDQHGHLLLFDLILRQQCLVGVLQHASLIDRVQRMTADEKSHVRCDVRSLSSLSLR